MPITIFYHADCPDGFGAAYAAWRRFGDTATYRPMHHGQPWEMAEIAGHDVYILDFSFSPDALEAMAGMANSVIQIDHHASARQHSVEGRQRSGKLQPPRPAADRDFRSR